MEDGHLHSTGLYLVEVLPGLLPGKGQVERQTIDELASVAGCCGNIRTILPDQTNSFSLTYKFPTIDTTARFVSEIHGLMAPRISVRKISQLNGKQIVEGLRGREYQVLLYALAHLKNR